MRAHMYSAPSYEDVMREYESPHPTELARNERMSITLPSYESLHDIDELTPTRPQEESAKTDLPQRTDSRSEKQKKPLHVRRIKSDKLHLKEFRLNLSGQSNVSKIPAIEPITPPPQYDEKQLGRILLKACQENGSSLGTMAAAMVPDAV
ncbi:transmembrane 51 [Pelobates cultripes]|uniref:Transmembrane 51 n=1 Tax=Pelobates cultripes TaxID=61616 RepID=A0AAD1TAU6_PELCU|nr:transmembrane 51 [Pelobates cultripes]